MTREAMDSRIVVVLFNVLVPFVGMDGCRAA
jgi:hypothetical protein